jgi:uncharacterized phage protein gp47/JayE
MAYAPPSIGPAGLSIPSYTDILNDNLDQFLAIFGSNQYVGQDSAIYQLLSILSLKQSDTCQGLQFAYNNASPLTAVGAGLDRVVKLNGIARMPYSYSTATLTITGTPGTILTNALAQDANGNQWLFTYTIPGGGSGTVLATCTTAGNVTAGAGTISIIATPQLGWASVSNSADATPGNPIETDSQLRARQAISVAIPSSTRLAGTIAALAALVGLSNVNVLENPTGSTDAFGNPAHSITCVVGGSASVQQMAQTIYANRGIGPLTNGDVSGSPISQTQNIVVTDPNTGYQMTINFISPPVSVPIYVTLNVHLLPGGTSATLAQIQADVVSYLNSLQIGQDVRYGELWGAALNARSNPDVPTFAIQSLFSGTGASPSGTADITLDFYQRSSGVNANVVVNSV